MIQSLTNTCRLRTLGPIVQVYVYNITRFQLFPPEFDKTQLFMYILRRHPTIPMPVLTYWLSHRHWEPWALESLCEGNVDIFRSFPSRTVNISNVDITYIYIYIYILTTIQRPQCQFYPLALFVLPGQAGQHKTSRENARQDKPSRCRPGKTRKVFPGFEKNTVIPIWNSVRSGDAYKRQICQCW